LVENSRDDYWGDGLDGGTGEKGKNVLGKLLVKVRDELRRVSKVKEFKPTAKREVRYKFKVQEVDGIPYRLPQIDLEQHPFKGVAREVREVKTEMFQRIEENERRIEGCVLEVDPKKIIRQAFFEEKKEEKTEEKPYKHKREKRHQKPNFTHFLSIPVGFDDGIRRNYAKLVESISAICKVPERDITLPSMLHLTVMMVDLSEDSKLKKAQDLL